MPKKKSVPTKNGTADKASKTAVPEGRPQRVFSSNKRAYYEYEVLSSVEAGVELTGTEIKSVRAGKVNLRDSYARVQNGEVLLYNMHVSPYDQGNI